jgi:hypothetical protein
MAAQLAVANGREVVGLATTNQAVGELQHVGIPALTIARLRAECGPLAAGTVVILDEISQVSTADAEVVASAVIATPEASLWCAGDVAQAQSVRAGGLADDVERLARHGAIPAPALTHNRRQLDDPERAALVAYRQGDVQASQELRRRAGIEHELDSPAVTKAAMADAVVADIDEVGPRAVVALCATHSDAEELADHIRARLAERGALGGPVITGPGWASTRDYAEGELLLLHAPFRHGADRLHNNSGNGHGGDSRRAGRLHRRRTSNRPRSGLRGRDSSGRPTQSVPRVGPHGGRRPGRHLGAGPPAG